VTSGQRDRSPPSPSVLCGHPRHHNTIPGTTPPSPTLWGYGTTRCSHASCCAPSASHQQHPRVSVRTMTPRKTSTPPPSKLLLGRHRARHDVPPEARFARTAVHSVVLFAMPLDVARIVRHACNLPSPWSIKGGAVPWPRGGGGENSHSYAFRLHHDIGTCLNQYLWDLEARPPLPPCL
jgi:hypothetical protein